MMMKFIDHTPVKLTQWLNEISGHEPELTDRRQLTHYFINKKDAPRTIASIVESRFLSAEKPFFNVYPKVLDALSKTSLAIRPDQIQPSVVHSLPAISIRLPIGGVHEAQTGTNWFIISVFNGAPHDYLKRLGLHKLFMCNDKPFIAVYYNNNDAVSLSTVAWDSSFDDVDAISHPNINAANLICRIALGVMMLAADPDYIKPVLLKADEGKTTPIEERIARAKNRGVYGFTIGEDIERSPHFRRPHFAIRWTGKGAAVPKLVPVKGAVVGKALMTTVPTGYEQT